VLDDWDLEYWRVGSGLWRNGIGVVGLEDFLEAKEHWISSTRWGLEVGLHGFVRIKNTGHCVQKGIWMLDCRVLDIGQEGF
jgi:hypothetical protein